MAFTTAVDLFPVSDTPMVSMQRIQKQNVILPSVSAADNTDEIAGKLKDVGPATVELISGSNWEPLWDRWVHQHHYLGFRKLLGHRLKYLAFLNDRPVAAPVLERAGLEAGRKRPFLSVGRRVNGNDTCINWPPTAAF